MNVPCYQLHFFNSLFLAFLSISQFKAFQSSVKWKDGRWYMPHSVFCRLCFLLLHISLTSIHYFSFLSFNISFSFHSTFPSLFQFKAFRSSSHLISCHLSTSAARTSSSPLQSLSCKGAFLSPVHPYFSEMSILISPTCPSLFLQLRHPHYSLFLQLRR